MPKKINIRGVIIPNDDKWIYDWFEIEATCPKDVFKEINEANGDALEVIINSGGGDVFTGSEIYTNLKEYEGEVITKIPSIAASAASIIAMAGSVVKISPTAQIMIHNVASRAQGDYRDLMKEASIIENYNKSIANAYRLKTKLDESELLELMNKETWMSAQQAKEKGFVDEILFDTNNQLVANLSNSLLPLEVINKVRNMENQKKKGLLEAKLNFLKLKGAQHD